MAFHTGGSAGDIILYRYPDGVSLTSFTLFEIDFLRSSYNFIEQFYDPTLYEYKLLKIRPFDEQFDVDREAWRTVVQNDALLIVLSEQTLSQIEGYPDIKIVTQDGEEVILEEGDMIMVVEKPLERVTLEGFDDCESFIFRKINNLKDRILKSSPVQSIDIYLLIKLSEMLGGLKIRNRKGAIVPHLTMITGLRGSIDEWVFDNKVPLQCIDTTGFSSWDEWYDQPKSTYLQLRFVRQK